MKFMNLLMLTLLLTLTCYCHQLQAQAHPNMFLNQDEVDGIKAKVQANQQPWKGGYDQVIAEANTALNQGPYSVTFSDLNPSDPHMYRTELPYCGWSKPPPYGDGQSPDCRDGQVNPGADREDYKQAGNLSNALRNLGQAYAFTGDSRYAERAILLINKWCLDPDTYMVPTYTGFQSKIELSITMPGMFYCADMIYNYSGWNSSDKAAFLDWVKDFAETGKEWGASNNFENWRIVTISAAGALLDDSGLLNYAFDCFRSIVPTQVNKDGFLMPELGRTKSLSYSLYALNAMVQAAEIARHRGVNLYDWTSDGTKGLKFIADTHAYYAANPSAWPFEQISGLSKNDNMAMWEVTYSFWQNQSHLDAINRWGRPLEDIRIMGWTTLTHANLFELSTAPRVATPMINPNGGSSMEPVDVTITCATDGAQIHYTTDGSEPTSSSQLYTGPFTVSQDTTVKAKAFKAGIEDSYASSVTFIIGRLLANSTWQNIPFELQNGQFTFTFDIKPVNTTVNGLAGLSQSLADAYTEVAAIVRLSPEGVIDVRDGGNYRADASLPYTLDMVYHVYMIIDVPSKTYSVTVTPDGSNPVVLATNYSFRSEQSACVSLENLAIYASQGKHEISNILLDGSPPPTEPQITVLSPSGGETWQADSQQLVTWTSQGTVGNVNISLSTDGGTNWISLEANSTNDGSQTITVPNSISTTCKIKVSDVSGTPSDTSNSNFTISQIPPTPSITVTVPNGGQAWLSGSQKTITWTWEGSVGTLTIDLSTNGGTSWSTLIASTANDGTETITIPDSPSTACRIRVREPDHTPTDMSDTNFTIETNINPPSISVDKMLIDFDEVELGRTSTLDFQISNTGGGTLSGTISSNKPWIEVQPTSLVLEGSQSVIVNVTVDNEILNKPEGEYTGIITITSNDPVNDTITLEVTLTATCVLVKPNPYDPTKGNLTFFGDGIVPGETTIKIYTLTGELIAVIPVETGIYNMDSHFRGNDILQWDGNDIVWSGQTQTGEYISNGIYIYTYESPKEKGVGKFTVIKK